MKTQPIKVQSLTATQRLFQKPWLASVAMALGFWVASSLVATAEPTPTPAAPAALPNHPPSGEPASPAGADLEPLPQVSTQAQDLQVADPVAVSEVAASGADTVAVPASRVEGRSLADLPAPVEPSSSVTQDSEGEGAAASDGPAPDQADLARQSQNPIANLISVPFQNNTNFGMGLYDRTGNVLNIQPVIPIPISNNWLLINRTIIPVAYQPELAPAVDSAFGLGDIFYQSFFSPTNSGSFTWGVGPAILLPTATDEVLGTGKWSIGPTAVGLITSGPIVAGALVNNVWSIAGDSDRSDVSLLTLQPFFNYNFEGGWYINTSPIITANWLATGEQWTVPIGGGFGRVFNIGSQPINASIGAYWNAVHPDGAADWTLRTQITLLFPK